MKQYYFLRKITLAVAFSIYSLVASAQISGIQWDKTFGGGNSDFLNIVFQTSDGGFILGGSTLSNNSGDMTQASNGSWDYWIVKTDANGNKMWDKTFGGNDWDELQSIAQTTDGGYILGGKSDSGISGDKSQANKGYNSDYWIIKIDASGNKLWDKTIGGNTTEELKSVAQTPDGGYILGGHSYSDISGDRTQATRGNSDYWIVKLDSIGNKLWDKAFGGWSIEYLYKVLPTFDGGYILGGYSLSPISHDKTQPSKDRDFWLVKLNATGTKLWDKTIGGGSDDWFISLSQTADGGYIAGGYSNSGISGDKSEPTRGIEDYWVVKLAANGNILWDKTIGGNSQELLYGILETSNGNYILAGSSNSGISGDKTQTSKGWMDYWIVTLDANGIKTNEKTIGGNGNDYLYSFCQTLDGGYLLGGFSGSIISGDKTQGCQGGWDYWIVKLGPDLSTTGINESDSALNLSISPNPSQGKFQLQLTNLTTKTAAINVFDLIGRLIYQQEIPVAGNQINEEINLPKIKGMYVLQVKAGEQTSTRKIVVE